MSNEERPRPPHSDSPQEYAGQWDGRVQEVVPLTRCDMSHWDAGGEGESPPGATLVYQSL